MEAGERIVMFTHRGRQVRFLVGNSLAPSDDYIQAIQSSGRFYEMRALEKMADIVPWGGAILDIGANVGNHSVFFGLFTDAKHIYPFEANPLIAKILERNLELNGITHADISNLRIALGEAEAEATLRVEDLKNWGSGHLRFGPQAKVDEASFQVAVNVYPLDSFHFNEVHLIKIDVEGHEWAVLKGAQRTLIEHRPFVFIELRSEQRARITGYLDTLGYRVIDCFQDHRGMINALFACFS